MLHAVIFGSFRRRPPSPSPSSLLASLPAPPPSPSSSAAAAAAHTGSSADVAAAAPGVTDDSGAAFGDDGCGFGAAAPEHDARTMIARLRKLDMWSSLAANA